MKMTQNTSEVYFQLYDSQGHDLATRVKIPSEGDSFSYLDKIITLLQGY